MTSYTDDLNNLWKIIQESSPEQKETIINSLDEDTVNALRSMKNPYKKPVYSGTKDDRYLVFSVINLREKYLQRFAMTSLIGYVYRMLDEYEPSSSENFVSENSPEFVKKHTEKLIKLETDKPREILLNQLREADAAIREIEESVKENPDNLSKVKSELGKQLKLKFFSNAKLIKLNQHNLSDSRKETAEKLAKVTAELSEIKRKIAEIHSAIPEIEGKIARKVKFDERMKEFESSANLSVIIQKLAAEFKLTAAEAEQPVVNFEIDIDNKKKFIDSSEESIGKLESEKASLSEAMGKIDEDIEKEKSEFDKLKEEYKFKFKIPSFKSNPLDAVRYEKYEATDEDLDEIEKQVKIELEIEKTAEEHAEETQSVIQEFLDKYFVYNPDNHVSCAYKPNYVNLSGNKLKTDEKGEITEETYERSVIPPDDTFYRWNRYVAANYEELRQATDDIYAEKSDFEFDVVPLEVFSGENAEERADEFNRKYSDEFEYDVRRVKFNTHNLMGNFAANREKTSFYNENTEIIEQIINQSKEDEAMGKKMMKERAKQKKADNVKKSGPYAKDLNSRQEHSLDQLREHGVKHVDDIITSTDVPKDYEESTKDEIEVDVHEIKPRRRKGKRLLRGRTVRSKFHIPAVELKENQVSVKSAAEVRDELSEKEKKAMKKKRGKK